MIPEELELYKELQPVFLKDWRVGDKIASSNELGIPAAFIAIGIVVALREVQKIQVGDIYFPPIDVIKNVELSKYLHLPLPIDPVNHERGLLGMVKDFSDLIYYPRLKYAAKEWCCQYWIVYQLNHRIDVGKPQYLQRLYGSTPTLALLRAIKEQEGV
jgi:hypothetical protein